MQVLLFLLLDLVVMFLPLVAPTALEVAEGRSVAIVSAGRIPLHGEQRHQFGPQKFTQRVARLLAAQRKPPRHQFPLVHRPPFPQDHLVVFQLAQELEFPRAHPFNIPPAVTILDLTPHCPTILDHALTQQWQIFLKSFQVAESILQLLVSQAISQRA